jgi:hypothetical protein
MSSHETNFEPFKTLLISHFKLTLNQIQKTTISRITRHCFNAKIMSTIYLGMYIYAVKSFDKVKIVSKDCINYDDVKVNTFKDIPINLEVHPCNNCNCTGFTVHVIEQNNFLMREIYKKCIECNGQGENYNVEYMKIYKYSVIKTKLDFGNSDKRTILLISKFINKRGSLDLPNKRSEEDQEVEVKIEFKSYYYYIVEYQYNTKYYSFIRIGNSTILYDKHPYSLLSYIWY